MAESDRKARIREYKENPPVAGIFRVRNTVTGRSLIRPSSNVSGRLNGQRFQLEMRSHPDRDLQADWNDLGPGAFEFEVLDELERNGKNDRDLADELRLLHQMWLERLPADSLYPTSGRGAYPAA